MKFRTDFVTNSSDSSFLAFNVKNKALFQFLNSLGIKIEGTKDNEFSDKMRIVLPSGASTQIDGANNWSLPYVDSCQSISAWIVAMLLSEVDNEDDYEDEEEEKHSDFSRELIAIFNKADITHLDWNAIEDWSSIDMMPDLHQKFNQMDADVEDALIEHTYGFEDEVGPCIYAEVHNGKRMIVGYSNTIDIGTEDCNGLYFVVTGQLQHFESRDNIVKTIEDMGGIVSENITKDTDYVICNDIRSTSPIMEKAKELGISVLTELAFIRRFCNVADFDGIKDSRDIYREAWPLTFEGKVLDFVVENGTGPIDMEVWKDGKWQMRESDHKIAAKNASILAKREKAKSFTRALFENESGNILKNLLVNKASDCLTMECSSYINSISFDELCANDYIFFEQRKASDTVKQDCCIRAEMMDPTDSSLISNVVLSFTIFCKHSINELPDYKNRGIEICSHIIDQVNGKDLPENGKLYYSSLLMLQYSDEYEGYSLRFDAVNDMDKRHYDISFVKNYNRNNATIAEALLTDPLLREKMGIEGVSASEAFADGFFRTSECYSNEMEGTYQCRIIITWYFAKGADSSVAITLVSNDEKLLSEVSPIIIEKLSGMSLSGMRPLKYISSKERIKRPDGLFCKELTFYES